MLISSVVVSKIVLIFLVLLLCLHLVLLACEGLRT